MPIAICNSTKALYCGVCSYLREAVKKILENENSINGGCVCGGGVHVGPESLFKKQDGAASESSSSRQGIVRIFSLSRHWTLDIGQGVLKFSESLIYFRLQIYHFFSWSQFILHPNLQRNFFVGGGLGWGWWLGTLQFIDFRQEVT